MSFLVDTTLWMNQIEMVSFKPLIATSLHLGAIALDSVHSMNFTHFTDHCVWSFLTDGGFCIHKGLMNFHDITSSHWHCVVVTNYSQFLEGQRLRLITTMAGWSPLCLCQAGVCRRWRRGRRPPRRWRWPPPGQARGLFPGSSSPLSTSTGPESSSPGERAASATAAPASSSAHPTWIVSN